MTITHEKPTDELDAAAAVDVIGTLHEKLLARLKVAPIQERFELEDLDVLAVGPKMLVTVTFRTAEGPASLTFLLSREAYAFGRLKFRTVEEVSSMSKTKKSKGRC